MPAQRSSKRTSKKGKKAAKPEPEPEVEVTDAPEPMQTDEPEPSSSSLATSAEHALEAAVEKVADVVEAAQEFVEEMTMTGVEVEVDGESGSTSKSGSVDPNPSSSGQGTPTTNGTSSSLTMEERKAKMEQLRRKIAASSKANRASLVEEASKAKLTGRDAARLEKQRKLAEVLRSKADAEERGEDVERAKNWGWTIEENDEWEKKLARKARRADFEFHDDAHAARRRYKKDLDLIKPDMEAYNKQKAIAMGHAPGALVGFNPSAATSASALQMAVSSQEQKLASENLYRDANTLIYGDNKPSEEAIDRVVGKINKDIDKKGKFSRKRLNEEEGDITYINEHNRVFNKKIARYYDKYTSEIRASFERGTAL